MTFVPRILIVDDEKRIRSGCVKMLTEDGFSATSAETAEAGLAIIKKEHFDIILLDLMMSGMSGLDALVQLRMLHPDTVVIVITGYATLEYSIEAMKGGHSISSPSRFLPKTCAGWCKRRLNTSAPCRTSPPSLPACVF